MNVISFTRSAAFLLIVLFSASALAQVKGVLRVVKGDVQIKSGDSGQMIRARLGQEVHPKDTIITGKDARAKIVMIDNNEINISPDSNVVIQNYEFNPAENKKDVLLNVLYGKVRSKVEQKYDGKTSKFQVKTPAAVAGVRGTDFITSFDAKTKSSSVVTFRGAVEFGLPGPGGSITNSVSVTPGKIAQSVAGVPPAPPAVVPKSQLAQMDNESKADGASGPGARQPAQDKRGGTNNSNGNGTSNGSGSSSGSSSNSSSNSSTSSSSNASTTAAPGPTASSASTPAADAAPSESSSATSSGGDSSRSPASTTASAATGTSTAAPTTAAAPATVAPPAALTAGAPEGSMLQSQDMASNSASTNMANIPKAPTVPMVVTPVAAVVVNPTPTQCQTCNQILPSIVTGGSSKLTVHVSP